LHVHRYLERNMRENLGFEGTPIRLYLRARRTADKPNEGPPPAAAAAGAGGRKPSKAGRGGSRRR
jgi:hypothetical protein